jgi:hypothetical protein
VVASWWGNEEIGSFSNWFSILVLQDERVMGDG